MANRQGIAFLLAALLILDAVSAQLGTVAKPNFRGQNKILAMADPVKQAPIKQQAVISQVAGGAKHATVGKPKVKKGEVKHAGHHDGDDNNGDDDDKDYDYNPKKKEECSKPPKKETCTNNPPRFPSYHNTYELKYQTIGCSMRTVDQIVEECATIDIIKERPECIKKVVTAPVKVNRINEVKKKIQVVNPVQKKIQVLKTVQKPVETLVTECVTVWEVVEKTVCVDSLQEYTTNERHIVEDKVKIRYEEPKKTEIRVVKPVQKKIKVIRTACAKYEASISQKTCTKEKKKCDNNDYDNKDYDNKDHGYGMGGNQYKAVKADGIKSHPIQKQAVKEARVPSEHQGANIKAPQVVTPPKPASKQ